MIPQARNKINQKKTRKKKSSEILITALLLMVFILSLVMFLRIINNNPLFPIGDSYYNLRIAQALQKDPFLSNDQVQGTIYEPNPYHYLLAILFSLFPVTSVAVLLPLLMGVLSAIIFFKILLLLGINRKYAAHSLFVLAVTPVFVTLFTSLSLYGFVAFLSLSALMLALYKKSFQKALSVLLFIILALTSLTGFLITIIILFALFLMLKKNLKALLSPIIIPLAVLVPFALFSNYTLRFLGFHSFAFKNFLSILQASFGFDMFLLVLFLAGFLVIWIKKKEKRLFHLATLIFFIFSLFNIFARIFTSFIITVYCVVAITYFYKRRWDLDVVKTGTLLLVLCSLVFSVTNQITLLVNAQPGQDVLNALLFLKDLDNGVVLTSQENGFLVEFYSEKRVLLDSNTFLMRDYPNIKRDSDTLFNAARFTDAEPLLNDYDLRYILITPAMKEGLWDNSEQGLWFLMVHSDRFVKKYEQKGTSIWEYLDTG